MNFATHPDTDRELLSNTKKVWEFMRQFVPGILTLDFELDNY